MIVLDTHIWVWWVHGTDQIIVATARVLDCSLVTSDDKILKYQHVTTVDR